MKGIALNVLSFLIAAAFVCPAVLSVEHVLLARGYAPQSVHIVIKGGDIVYRDYWVPASSNFVPPSYTATVPRYETLTNYESKRK
jgi:hypothetical protein